MNKYRYKPVCLALMCYGNFFSQEDISEDSTKLDIRYFPKDFTDSYRTEEFNYSINDSGGINLVQQILQKFFGWLNELFGINLNFLDYRTLEIIIYSLMALGALYLLFKFLKEVLIDTIFKESEVLNEGFNFLEEDISKVDFELLIQDALAKENYRLATRYLYLKSLKSLTEKKIIDWHSDKTNADYLNEIAQAETRQLFKRISYIYDYVWYGEFVLDHKMYKKNLNDFLKLNAV